MFIGASDLLFIRASALMFIEANVLHLLGRDPPCLYRCVSCCLLATRARLFKESARQMFVVVGSSSVY